MKMNSWRSRTFMSPDDGGGPAGAGDAPAVETTPEAAVDAPQAPAYFSQFRKENRERFQSLSKYRNLDELADAALKADDVKEPDYTGYLKMPTKDSTREDIKDFLSKLGVPDGPDGYDIPKEQDQNAFVQGVEKTLREAAYRAGMTTAQAKSMWGVFRAVLDTSSQQGEAYMKERKEGFDARYGRLFEGQYGQKAQQEQAVKESLGYFKTFLTETGIGKALEESGAIYDERIVKALADYQKRNRGSFNSGPASPKVERQGTKLHYSEDFGKAFKRR